MSVILRRRKLGLTSCREIGKFMGAKVVRNDKPLEDGNGLLFRWGTTSNVPKGYKVVNKSAAIHKVNNKGAFRKTLDEHDLCPNTYFDINDVQEPFDVVVRPAKHAQGRHVYRCTTQQELRKAVNICGVGYYISDYIKKTREVRVFVAQGRAVWVAEKTPGNPEDVAWNVAKGGRFDNIRWGEWPLKAVKTAIEGFNLSDLDFGGVDVMIDADGACYILEINSAPSQTSPYRQESVAKVFSYMEDNGLDNIPLVEDKGKYLKFIHPALDNKAKMVGA